LRNSSDGDKSSTRKSTTGTANSQMDRLRYPRTLKDLQGLTAAAKEAHWRENDDSDSASSTCGDGPTTEPHYFSDDSDGTSDEEDETVAIVDVDEVATNRPALYNTYFSDAMQRSINDDNYDDNDRKTTNDLFQGSNLQNNLAPVVKVFRAQANLALSNQIPALACLWDIGSYNDHHVLTFHTTIRDSGAVVKKQDNHPLKTPLSPLRQRKSTAVFFLYKSR
jgi:hypothetical protein